MLSPTVDLEVELGLGSLERTELILRLEQRLSIKLPESTLNRVHTPAGMVEVLAACRAGSPGAEVQPAPARGESARENSTPGTWYIPDSVRTLADMARFRADAQGDRTHLILLGDDGGETRVSFGQLWNRGLRCAAGLAALGLKRGDRVALILPTGEDFFAAFLGISCAGCVPVPLYPPARLNDLPAYLEREGRILESAQARALISNEALLQVGKLLKDRAHFRLEVASVSSIEATSGSGVARVQPDDLALIQYSSGSTGDPKGVALSHRSLIANMRAIGQGLAFGPMDVPVSWLPLYHDMGLIGTWLSPYLHGLQVVMMSPLQFLARPERWLWAFHRYRGSISPAPNFAYDLCCRKVRDEDIQGLDLSSWRSAMNGAEPVRVDTIDRFCQRFGPFGFRREAMMPVYGLAETSVALAFPPLNRGPRIDRIDRKLLASTGRVEPSGGDDVLALASCGHPLQGHELRVLEIDGPAELPERVQGRIVFRGPSSMSGYFGRPEATAAVRHGDWIDTGDLGYLAEGELFVTGRMKDLVIKGGRKYHPQDIEQAVLPLEGIRKGCVVAFDVPDPVSGEAIVVLAESHVPVARHPALAEAIVTAVQSRIGTPPDRVRVLPPGSLPKTSSGKLKRRESRSQYLDGTLAKRSSGALRMAGLAARTALRRAGTSLLDLGSWLRSFYSTAVATLVLTLGFPLVLLLCRGQRGSWEGGRWALRLATLLAGIPVHRIGPPLPASGAILVSNHASYLDAFVLTLGLEQPFLFTAKASVFSLPVLGRLIKRLGHIQVERGRSEGRLQSYKVATDAVRQGQLVHFFPEATFTPASGLRPFRLGAFQLAAEMGLPIIPVAICGTRQALRDGDKRLRPARIEVRVLAPILSPPFDLREVTRVRDAVREVLAKEVEEPVLDIVTAALPEGTELVS